MKDIQVLTSEDVQKIVEMTIEKMAQRIEKQSDKDIYLSFEEVCAFFNRKPRTINRWLKNNYLPQPIKKGNKKYFLKSDIFKKTSK